MGSADGRSPFAGSLRVPLRYKTPWFDYLFVSKAEMNEILVGTGRVVERFIDSDGSSYAAIIKKSTSVVL